MIIGIGMDLVSSDRIKRLLARFGSHFEGRFFHPFEQEYCQRQRDPAKAYAKRFAAKEAGAKAVGLGFRQGIRFLDFRVSNDIHGKPTLEIHGKAWDVLISQVPDAQKNPEGLKIHVSLCDEGSLAQAFVVISYEENR